MKILKKYNVEDFIFIDIETACGHREITEDLSLYDAWYYDNHKKNLDDNLIDLYYKEASLYAEYGKIVCITIGVIRKGKIFIKSFFDDNEKELLHNFNETVSTLINHKTWLVGHAITGFDVPFIMKRCVINEVSVHDLFDVSNLKPWEVKFFDTMTLWKGTGWKNSSLISITSALGLPSPKDEISGKDVSREYWTGNSDKIVRYCEKDVKSVINIILKFRGDNLSDYTLNVNKENDTKDVKTTKSILTHLFEGGKYTPEMRKKLNEFLKKQTPANKKRAIEILNSIPTKAKGKETYITKKDIKEFD